MKKGIVLCLFPVLLAGCGRRHEKAYVPAEKFTVDLRLPVTPVKDQGTSPLCWVYAMLATIETEHIMQGDSVNLSPDYVARMYLSGPPPAAARENGAERTARQSARYEYDAHRPYTDLRSAALRCLPP